MLHCQDGLIGMLDVLLEQKDRFDYVLVEAIRNLRACSAHLRISLCAQATGIADPEAVCEARPAMIIRESK